MLCADLVPLETEEKMTVEMYYPFNLCGFVYVSSKMEVFEHIKTVRRLYDRGLISSNDWNEFFQWAKKTVEFFK